MDGYDGYDMGILYDMDYDTSTYIHLRPILHRSAGLDSENSDKLGWGWGVAIGYIT